MLCDTCGFRSRDGAKSCGSCGGTKAAERLSPEVYAAARESDERESRRRRRSCLGWLDIFHVIADWFD